MARAGMMRGVPEAASKVASSELVVPRSMPKMGAPGACMEREDRCRQ